VGIDSTWTTPYLFQPLELGVDFVVHSFTKYIGGHSDVTGGIVVVPKGSRQSGSIKTIQTSIGGIASPFSSWLAVRGLRTLAVRMERHSENALKVAQFLEKHPSVGRVHYPGLKSHVGYGLVNKQFRRGLCGGLLSFELKKGNGLQEAIKVVAQTKIFVRATSLGSTESLIELSALMNPQVQPSTIRLSVGLEEPLDLIEDLTQALAILDERAEAIEAGVLDKAVQESSQAKQDDNPGS